MNIDPDNLLNQLVGAALTIFIVVIVLLGVLLFRQIWIHREIASTSSYLKENLSDLEEVTEDLLTELEEIQTTNKNDERASNLDDITNLLDSVEIRLDSVEDGLDDVTSALETELILDSDSPHKSERVYQDSLDEVFTIFALLIGVASVLIGILLGTAIHIQHISANG